MSRSSVQRRVRQGALLFGLVLGPLGVACAKATAVDEMVASDGGELASDVDQDGIDDSFERQLMLTFAPEVRLHPADWTRPANVDWYLTKVALRFSHDHCSDHQVLALGEATQANLAQQTHPTENLVCFHTSTIDKSSDPHGELFLQPEDDAVHEGLSSPSEWRMYGHVKKSSTVARGYDVQFWFFYAYDFAAYGFNHEGDWEHITVSTTASGELVSVWYAEHNYGTRYTKSDLSWNGTHPIVYSAIGTHASYPRAGDWPTHYPTFTDRTKAGGPAWQGWKNIVNVGEKAHPMEGQTFIQYGGRWGEIGALGGTSGPMTPSAQRSWNEL